MTQDFQNIHNILASLIYEVDELKKENAELKQRLAKYETPKNSNNSSVAPSKDENRPKRRSLREKSGRKPGGQKGREGNTLKMVPTPDITEKHIPGYCTCCGKDISEFSYEFAGKRQVIDIPEIKTLVTEHQVFKKVCTCGHENFGSYPSNANAPVSYGENIESLIGYFHTRQYIPFKRMQEVFTDIFHLPISEGGIHYLLGKLVKKAQPAYELIKQKLLQNTSLAIGSDETGVKIDGKKYWAWTWQNDEATFISITDNRGEKSITGNFRHGFAQNVLVHDCWKSHFNTPALSHQICTAHLLRELNYLTERYNHKWSRICKSILIQAINLNNKLSDTDYYAPIPQRTILENRLDKILNLKLPTENKEMISFQKRLLKYRDYLFTFLYHPKVPPDNNASERAIRNIKVKQKVSGQFKSTDGSQAFAILRSVTDTIIKNNQNVLNSLKVISKLQTD
jgi:transposase